MVFSHPKTSSSSSKSFCSSRRKRQPEFIAAARGEKSSQKHHFIIFFYGFQKLRQAFSRCNFGASPSFRGMVFCCNPTVSFFRGRRQGRQPLNSAPPAPHEWLALRASQSDQSSKVRRAPKPPTLRRRAPKNTKNPSGGWGRAFWPESGSLISVSKSIPPPPRFEGT